MIQKWAFEELPLKDAYRITTFFSTDARGSFVKDYSKEVFEQNGIHFDLDETFYTSSHRGVIRGIHFQKIKQQPKLMRCIYGHVFHVIVDLRENSPTFKKWMSFDLCGDKFVDILVPAGFGNGYMVLADSIMSYKCAEKFYGEFDSGIKWDDSDLNITWPLNLIGGKKRVILSDKDLGLPSFKVFMKNYSNFLGNKDDE